MQTIVLQQKNIRLFFNTKEATLKRDLKIRYFEVIKESFKNFLYLNNKKYFKTSIYKSNIVGHYKYI